MLGNGAEKAGKCCDQLIAPHHALQHSDTCLWAVECQQHQLDNNISEFLLVDNSWWTATWLHPLSVRTKHALTMEKIEGKPYPSKCQTQSQCNAWDVAIDLTAGALMLEMCARCATVQDDEQCCQALPCHRR